MSSRSSTAPLVSVVMTAYNAAPYVAEAVASILGQRFRDFELIVVDDGSTDETPAILARLAAADRRVRVYRQENAGIAVAANRGCRLARGTYLARMDADDVAMPERLGLQVEFLEAHPEVAVVGGAKLFFSAARAAPAPTCFPLSDREIQAALAHRCAFSNSTVMMRRDAFWAVGGYRAPFTVGEDYDLWLRMSERYALANLPQVLVHYRVHPGQTSITRAPQQGMAGLAAVTLTRIRRAGGRDPLANGAALDMELLDALGIDRTEAELAVIWSYLFWAQVLTQFDDHAEASRLIDKAAARVQAVPGWRRLGALRLLIQMRLVCRLWYLSPRLFLLLKVARRAARELWWRLPVPQYAEP